MEDKQVMKKQLYRIEDYLRAEYRAARITESEYFGALAIILSVLK